MAASNAYLSIMVSASTAAAAAEASSSSANECGLFFFVALELAEPSGIMCAGKMLAPGFKHAFDLP